MKNEKFRRNLVTSWVAGLGTILIVLTSPASPAENPVYQSEYQGQESRTIKSLSADDIRQLEQGKGWGLAKAAELNGMPGPSHILQMKTEISLSEEQEFKVRALFEEMQSQAIALGKELVALEKTLNESFANRSINDTQLLDQLNSIAQVRRDLRFIHLAAHLKTPDILSTWQIEEYNRLRGYASGDPCTNMPRGHDAEMWKRHNNCN